MFVSFASIFASQLLIQLAVVGAVAAIVWWLLDMMASNNQRAQQRLDEIRQPNARKSDFLLGGKGGKAGGMSKVLEKASPALAKPLQPKSEKEVNATKSKLEQAGFRAANAAEIYGSLKIMGVIVGFFLSGTTIGLTHGLDKNSLTYIVAIALTMFFIPDVVIALITKSRKESIFYGLPDALDLMVVCVESGLSLDQAMRKVAEEMRESYRVIAEEFALSNMQLQMGRPRNEVLRNLGARTGVDDLKSLVAILNQADKFGTGVAQALRVQSDSMRLRRRQLAEEKAAKTAVKLIFPLVLFIFPAIFVVLLGPAMISILENFS